MDTCKTALLNLTSYCYGLQDGTTLGLIDASFAVDELDQSLGIDYDDENVLPAPEGLSNPVVEVWNNTDDRTFLAAGASLHNDAVTGVPIYYVAPHADDTWSGPPLDATQAQLTHYGFSQSLEEIRPTSQQAAQRRSRWHMTSPPGTDPAGRGCLLKGSATRRDAGKTLKARGWA